MKWTDFGVLSAKVGVTLLHDLKIFLVDGFFFCDMVHRHHAAVGEMSATVGEMPATVGKLNMI